MKKHFKKYWWLYVICIAVVAWPIVVSRMQQIPPIEAETARAIWKWIDSEIEKNYGTPMWDEFKALEDSLTESGFRQGDPRVNRISSLMSGESEILWRDLDVLYDVYGDLFDKWNTLSQKGIYYSPLEGIGRGRVQVPDFLFCQTSAKVLREWAKQAIARKDWDKALKQIEATADFGNSIRGKALIGHLFAVAIRKIVYKGYESFFRDDVPAEVEKAALESLVRLRNTDPVYNNLVVLSELRCSLERFPENRGGFFAIQSLFHAVGNYVLAREQIANKNLRDWANHFYNMYMYDLDKSEFPYLLNYIFTRYGFKWTTIPASVKWLKAVISSNTPPVTQFSVPNEFKTKTDLWSETLLLNMIFNPYWNIEDNLHRTRVASTFGRLYEIAFAARLYKREHGIWPKKVEDLVPDYLPSIGDSKKAADKYYTPYNIAERDVDPELKAILFGKKIPIPITWVINNVRNYATISDEIDLRSSLPWSEEPVSFVATAEFLQQHPKLVEYAKVWMKSSVDTPEANKDEWIPLDPDYARRVTDETDALEWSKASKKNLPLDKRGENRPTLTERTVQPPKAVRVTAKLHTPEKVVVIWSPGPDGIDDGGRIAYDPTNGTASRGDLLVFPENQ